MKHGREFFKKKQKNDIFNSSTQLSNFILAPAITIRSDLILEEKTNLQAKLSSIKALHTQ